MTDDDRGVVIQLMSEGTSALRASMAGIDDGTAARRPADGRWSVLECLEHVAVTERALLAGVRIARLAELPQNNPEREAKILNRAVDRRRFIAAPEVVIPGGLCRSASEAWNQFESARGETLQLVEKFEGDPRRWLTTHPLVRSPVNCYEMFMMIALHPKRHAMQIVEIRAMLESASG